MLSGYLAGNSQALYGSLRLPPLAPPGWLFGVAWTILYALMGFSAYLVYAGPEAGGARKRGLALYAVQLALNFSWSIVFFRLGSVDGALAVIVALDLLVAATMVHFRRVDPRAAWLMLPYLLWILFATYLTAGIRLLN